MKLVHPGLRVKFRASKEQIDEAIEFGNNFSKIMFGEKNINPVDHGQCDVNKK